MKRVKYLIWIAPVIALLSFISPTINTAKAAGPTVNFLINGSNGPIIYPWNSGGDFQVTLSWSTSGAVSCISSGSGSGSGWGYNASLSTSGSVSATAHGVGTSHFILTCYNAGGEFTTVTRTAIATPANGGICATSPEIVRSSVDVTITNLTTGWSGSMHLSDTDPQDPGPDIPVLVGDKLLISYSATTIGDESSFSMTAPSPFLGGSSTQTQTDASSGDFVIQSITSTNGVLEIQARGCSSSGAATAGMNFTQRVPTDFTVACSPPSSTITAGGSTSYSISTTAVNGFNSPVTFTSSISPNSGTVPAISFSNNNQVPPAVTAGLVSTTAATTPATYTITFTGTSGTIVHTCNVQLIVNAPISADIKCDSTDGPCSIPFSGTSIISWTSSGATTCNVTADTAPFNQSGTSNAGVPSGSLTTTANFNLACSGPGGTANDSVQVIVGSPPPTADIKCDGTDGPCNIANNGTSIISWTSTNATTCSVTSNPAGFNQSGTSNAGVSSGNLSGPNTYTYTLACTGPGGNASDLVNVIVASPPPANFTMGCSPATNTIVPGDATSYTITLGAVNGFNQAVHLDYSLSPGGKAVPGVSFTSNDIVPPGSIISDISTNASTGENTYTITYTASSSGYADQTCNVQLIVNAVPTPQSPINVAVSNSGVCGTIDISWKPAAGGIDPKKYNIYDRAAPSDPWNLVGSVDFDGSPAYSFNDPSPFPGQNYYAVAAVSDSGVESAYVEPPTTPIIPKTCSPDLTLSDKDIQRVDGKITQVFSPVQCSGVSEPAVLRPNGAIFTVNDIITFKINVCNSGSSSLTGLTVSDTLTNLSNPGNFSSTPPGCMTGQSIVGNKINFTLADIAASPPVQVCSITFKATVTAPVNPTAAIYRFQNVADVSATGGYSAHLFTPPYLFSVTGGVPNRNETAPY